ncbi:MAG: TauD/TfdA family dioxygenase [Rhodospirillaceae bacterium]|nr:TauD/TfdA family dioxygenase [Rhodospirillaceae bacterium]
MSKYNLGAKETETITRLLRQITNQYSSVEDEGFLTEVTLYSHKMPVGLRRFLNEFRLSDNAEFVVISGYPIDRGKIGCTPNSWEDRRKTTVEEEIYMLLCSTLIGDAFAWATQQGGYIVHDIVPTKGFEHEQVGASSKNVLYWHTEDAFHRYRADYVGLMCLRNPDKTATTVGGLDLSLLSEPEIELLFQPRYTIRPDNSHFSKHRGRKNCISDDVRGQLDQSYKAMEKADQDSEKVPILRGHREAPFICIDPVYMDFHEDDPEGTAALKALIGALDKNLQDMVLAPGDLLIIDNARVVHGRQPFHANYDGADRWLKRINLTSDLRKSADARTGASPRTIF